MAHEASKVFKRLSREIKILQTTHTTQAEGVKIFTFSRSSGDDYLWHALIKGPDDSLYEDLTFWIEIRYPIDYPRSSMEMRFITPCAHPNVMLTTGEICSDIFHRGAGLSSGGWSPMMTTYTMLVAVRNLLHDPNPNSPLNGAFAQEYEAATACKDPERKEKMRKKLRYTIETMRAKASCGWLPALDSRENTFSSDEFVIVDVDVEQRPEASRKRPRTTEEGV